MGTKIVQASHGAIWKLVARQHGAVSRGQLLELGLSSDAVRHRIDTGRLHPVHRGVYAVGRPDLSCEGRWMAAVLAGGVGAVLSHRSAAALWEIAREGDRIEISVPAHRAVRRPGIRVHRRAVPALEHGHRRAIPVTTPVATLIDFAGVASPRQLEAAVNEADKLDLISFASLMNEIARADGRPGSGRLRRLVERATFRLTDSELERRFLPLVARASLPVPRTRRRVEGFRADFFWPDLGLVVETDGLRYHRTPTQQARDRLRDQTHTAAGLVVLRFTHAQVVFEPGHVVRTLAAVGARLVRG